LVKGCAEDKIDFLTSRRSIRKFKQEKIELEEVLKIIDAARFAPSARNSQPWRFIIITDELLKEKLSEIHQYAWPLKGAPLGIAVACDKSASPTSFMLDCANAAIYLMLAAHACGIGSVWIQTLRDTEEISSLLSLPENLVPIAILARGYPEDPSPPPKPRLEIEKITFLNKYGNELNAKKPKVSQR